MTLTPAHARRGIAVARLSLGALALLAPRPLARAFGMDPARNPEAPLVGRLFGARNVAIALTLLTGAPEEQRRWLRYGVAIDLVDAAAALAGGLRGYLRPPTVVAGTAVALLAAAVGVVAQRPQTQR